MKILSRSNLLPLIIIAIIIPLKLSINLIFIHFFIAVVVIIDFASILVKLLS